MKIRETTAAGLFVVATMLGTCAVFSEEPVVVYSERSSSRHEVDEALKDVQQAVDDLERLLRSD